MGKILTILSTLAITLATMGFTSPVSAWKVSQGAEAICNQKGAATIGWSFTNKEPNKNSLTIDLVVTDKQTGKSTDKITVAPGETVAGQINTMQEKIGDGKLEFKMTWTDGRHGVDIRKADYSGVDCYQEPVCEYNPELKANDPECMPEEEPIEVCRDGEIIEIDPEERLESDTDTCPEVLPEVDPPAPELPNTGPVDTVLVTALAGIATFATVKRLAKEQ